jgi:hypothetical protein
MRALKHAAMGVAASIAMGGMGSAHATILTFDIDNSSIGLTINGAYGDGVTALTDGIGSYGEAGEGFTGNVDVDYGPGSPLFWTTGYSDLVNVMYEQENSGEYLQLTLTADAGYEVLLYDFDLGSWLGDYAVRSVRVTDETNAVLYESLADTLLLSAHSAYDFNTPLSGQSLTITVDQLGLATASDNIGIDNVRFGQTQTTQPIPEPATVTLLGLGIAALIGRARRKQS